MLFAVLLAGALANTEVLSFTYAGPTAALFDPSTRMSPLTPFEGLFNFASGAHESLRIHLQNVTYGSKYVARVCWPASHPADVSIAFDRSDGSLVVSGSRENVVALRAVDPHVPFNVHLSPTLLGVVPLDIIPILKALVTGVALSTAFVYAVVSYLL